jgi:predicted neuraminidase
MLFTFAVVAAWAAGAAVAAPLDLNGTVVPDADGSFFAYLSPPYPQNHAASIEQLPNGDLVIAWFSGLKEEAPNCSIAVSRLPAGSSQFTPSQVVSERINYSNQNPVLFFDTTTSVLHLYHAQLAANAGEGESTLLHLQSSDNGASWTAPEPFLSIKGGGVFDRNRIIVRKDGSLLFPLYFTTDGTPNSPFLLFSAAGNHSDWTGPRAVSSKAANLVQPSVVRTAPDTLTMFLRDREAKNIYACTSTDEGDTWTDPSTAAAGGLPNNNAGIEAFQLQSGATLLLFNNESGTGTRTPMTAALSYDGGHTWPYSRNLQVHDDNSTGATEYSYPTVLQTPDSTVHSAYTYDRICIKYRRFTEAWVKQGGGKLS